LCGPTSWPFLPAPPPVPTPLFVRSHIRAFPLILPAAPARFPPCPLSRPPPLFPSPASIWAESPGAFE
jgi:hypothetical protein